jgi:hypothetical protein
MLLVSVLFGYLPAANTDSVFRHIARLWSMILQSRLINQYGTPEARLDRFISLLNNPQTFGDVYSLLARLMLGIPETHLRRCCKTWTDRVVYTEEWKKFKAKNEEEWSLATNMVSVAASSHPRTPVYI